MDPTVMTDQRLCPAVAVEMTGPSGVRVSVPVTGEPGMDLSKVVAAQPFLDWVASVDKDRKLFVKKIIVQSIDMFGPRVGFVKFKTTALVDVGCISASSGAESADESSGMVATAAASSTSGLIEVPGIVFMRGGTVGVLIILECEGTDFTILTVQARVPVADSALPEIPAGMLDGSGNFRGVAADEIAQECHMEIKADDLVDLTELAYGDRWRGVFPSAGGCDEFIRLYLYRRTVEPNVLRQLEGRLTGVPP
jgi:ADP-sugar diphosphatase